MDGQGTNRRNWDRYNSRARTAPTLDTTNYRVPSSGSRATYQASYPYNARHQPTSNPQPAVAPLVQPQRDTSKLRRFIDINAASAAQWANRQIAQNNAQKKYHTAWQNYYQQYYENYYVAALQEQRDRFRSQQAAVVDSRESDGRLDQSEVQSRLRSEIIAKIKQGARSTRRSRWFWPLVSGVVAILILALLQYNGIIAAAIANYISPGASSNQTVIIGSGLNQPVNDEPRIIIPKINVNAPVVYGLTDLSEQSAQAALQNGVIHYPVAGATAVPGQKGNTVLLGHSSADFFAPGDYKFIFVQLNKLTQGDLFYLDYGKVRYTYKVAKTEIINPDQIDKLNVGTDKPYATLVTCDPPGTITNRLIVIAEQVSPNPNTTTATQDDGEKSGSSIPGKPKTVLENIFGK